MNGLVGWIGVDLDGTLVEYHGWKGLGDIGPPIPKMIERVRKWVLEEGKTVKIFTARAHLLTNPDWESIGKPALHDWMTEHLGFILPVVCEKDFGMYELWDDRCIQLITNTGQRVDGVTS